jgi:hypothetical protein
MDIHTATKMNNLKKRVVMVTAIPMRLPLRRAVMAIATAMMKKMKARKKSLAIATVTQKIAKA